MDRPYYLLIPALIALPLASPVKAHEANDGIFAFFCALQSMDDERARTWLDTLTPEQRRNGALQGFDQKMFSCLTEEKPIPVAYCQRLMTILSKDGRQSAAPLLSAEERTHITDSMGSSKCLARLKQAGAKE